jgi:phosphoglycolate phosphatase
MSVIIFDFDGTIADSFAFVSQFALQQAGRPALTLPERQREFGGLSIRGMMDKLDKPVWWGLWMFVYGRRVMTKHMGEVEPYPDIVETLRALHAQGHRLYILSSNRNKNVRLFLDNHGLTPYFYRTRGNASLLGKSFALRRLLLRDRLQAADCYYVGDETGDLEAARPLQIRSVAVTWGYNNAAALAAEKPSALVNTPKELLAVFAPKTKRRIP